MLFGEAGCSWFSWKYQCLTFVCLGIIISALDVMFSHLPLQCLMLVRCWYLSVSSFFLKTTQLISKELFHWHGINMIKYTRVKLQNPWAFNLSQPEKLNTSYRFQSFIPSRRSHLLPTIKKNKNKSLCFLDLFKLILLWLTSIQLKRTWRQLHRSDYIWTW